MAAKTSANAFNSFFYQQTSGNQQPTTGLNSNAKHLQETLGLAASTNVAGGEISDLHLKMSKKIAQLTKVIYALNSKNDEAENLIAQIRAQCDEEKEQLVQDMNKKLDEYKFRFSSLSDLSNKSNEMELKLKESEKQMEKLQLECDQLRISSIEVEENLTLTHKQELIDLNKMMEALKCEQDKQTKLFEERLKQHNYEIEDLKSKHRLELESVRQQLSASKDTKDQEILKLNADLKQLNSKLGQNQADFEQNMLKLKQLHEKELAAFKQNSTSEYQMLIEKLKLDLNEANKNNLESNKKYNLKLEEIVQKEDEIAGLKQQIDQLKLRENRLESTINSLNEMVLEKDNEKLNLESRLNDLNVEKMGLAERCELSARNLLDKSNQISKLEASSMQKSSLISDLNTQLSLVREKLGELEAERSNLANESSSLNDRQTKLIKQLEAKLETLTQQRHEELNEMNAKIVKTNQENLGQIQKMQSDHKCELDALMNAYEAKLNVEKVNKEQAILELQASLNKEFNHENQRLMQQQSELKLQLDKQVDELKAKNRGYELEVKNLSELLQSSQTNLDKHLHLSKSLTSQKDEIEKELIVIKELSQGQKRQIDELAAELEQSKFLYETSSKDSQLELKVKLEQLSKELNFKWSETLRLELDKLRNDLLKLKEEQLLNEITKLTEIKEEEIAGLKSIWQAKTNELLNEISKLKSELSERELREREKYDSIRTELESENKLLNEKMARLNEDYKSKLDMLQSQQNQEQKQIIDSLLSENEKKLNELKAKHLEDLKCQTLAHKSAIDSLKSKMERTKELELEVQLQEYNRRVELAKHEMEQNYYTEIDKLRHENESEMLVMRGELDKTVDQLKQKEREFEIKCDQFQMDLRMKQKQLNKLNDELLESKSCNMSLLEQIDQKNMEMREMRHDMQEELKNRERSMQIQLKEEINSLNVENMRQKQLLVSEFVQAQELLKQKIIETEKELRQLHDRYMNRESRPEDLEQIKQLKRQLAEYDEKFRMIKDEKKYFQMELLNRENNFNKMFNTMPSVGVINPLNANTKVKSTSKASTSSSTSASAKPSSLFQASNNLGRLDPIPGVESPLHDLNLNPNKILPKKFLS